MSPVEHNVHVHITKTARNEARAQNRLGRYITSIVTSARDVRTRTLEGARAARPFVQIAGLRERCRGHLWVLEYQFAVEL